MTVMELAEKLSLKRISGDGEKELNSCYICDLLSRVMNGCEKGDAWITVQTSLNVVAVAVLTEAACVILPEGIMPPEETVKKAGEEGVTILSSQESAYEIAVGISKLA